MNKGPIPLNRRSFLYGAGIALALPQFETFAAENPSPNDTPKRFVSIYHPDGVGLPLKADPAWKDWIRTPNTPFGFSTRSVSWAALGGLLRCSNNVWENAASTVLSGKVSP